MRAHLVLAVGVVGCAHDVPAYDPTDFETAIEDPSAPVEETSPPPPPISGGTLAASRDGHTVVFADSDRDVVWRVDAARMRVLGSATLHAGDEPGRVVEDGDGRFHVVLRRAGAIATIGFGTDTTIRRREVCAEPRGIAWDPSADVVHVVCTGGELVTLPAAGGPPLRSIRLEKDLRDVVVSGDRLLVTTFAGARILTVDAAGKVLRRETPAERALPFQPDLGSFEPGVAWRAIPKPGGGAVVVHQAGAVRTLPKDRTLGFYYADLVLSVLAIVDARGGVHDGPRFADAALPVDVAVCGDRVAIVAAGVPAVLVGSLDAGDDDGQSERIPLRGEPVAVACGPDDEFVVASREPARIWTLGIGEVDLHGRSRVHTGHRMFHRATAAGLACASCHPEGREDGRVWRFEEDGARRTQPIFGGVTAAAPFHWDGRLESFDALVEEVLVRRMGGDRPPRTIVDSMARWLDSLPAPKVRPAGVPAERGRAVFARAGCAGCHEDRADSFDVGTGGRFQAPDLRGVGLRAPYLHDGRARTLEERFGFASGEGHAVAAADVPALVEYLETL